MRHFKDPKFGPLYDALPSEVQDLAQGTFALLKQDPKHPSLHFKRFRDDLWSVRVGRKYRAPSLSKAAMAFRFWIGSHAEYDRLIRR